MPAVKSPLRVSRPITSLRSRVVERLRAAICAQELPQGARLVERQLCEMLGVSRTLVREALRQLEAEGLVMTEAYRGPSVAVLDRATAQSIYEVRAILEALAGKLFVERATPADRRKLTVAFERLQLAWEQDDVAASLRCTERFYQVIFAGARNDVIASTLAPLSGRIQRLRALSLGMPGRLAKSHAEMQAILDAALGDDPDAAWQACLVHVQNAASYALASFDNRAETQPAQSKKPPQAAKYGRRKSNAEQRGLQPERDQP